MVSICTERLHVTPTGVKEFCDSNLHACTHYLVAMKALSNQFFFMYGNAHVIVCVCVCVCVPACLPAYAYMRVCVCVRDYLCLYACHTTQQAIHRCGNGILIH